MAGPGDSLLIRAGLVRPDQLAEAQKLRARSGGTTGEWLVRLGAVNEEQLVDFYHRRLLVPRILAAQLARVPANVLLAVPAEMAAEFLVFPVLTDSEGALTLAMADPADTHVAEEVAFYSGRVCHRAVAAASTIRDAIHRSYRPRGLGGALVSPLEVRAVQPDIMTPHPVLDPVTAPLRATLNGVPPLEPGALPGPADDEPVLLTRAKGEGGAAAGAPARSRSVTAPRINPARAIEGPARAAGAGAGQLRAHTTIPGMPLPSERPTIALAEARDREEIATILLEYAATLAPIAALLVMRRGGLAGHDARGQGVNPERFRKLQLALDEPSLFRDVVQSLLPFRGPLYDAPAHRAIVGTLGRLPGDVLMLPIAVGGKALALLYAAGIRAPLPEPALRELADEAGAAYERLIRARRP